MFLSRRHTSNNQQQAPWDGPFAPVPSTAPVRFDPMVKTAGELVGHDESPLSPVVAAAPTAA